MGIAFRGPERCVGQGDAPSLLSLRFLPYAPRRLTSLIKTAKLRNFTAALP